ncbi:hypothetical protein PENTCL1PPCAC_13312, partial [Pristionchus entomophagus]
SLLFLFNPIPRMDIFSLPDVFHRKLMKTMEIKDRLTLRLTCRALEKLVADTHAGEFGGGAILLNYPAFKGGPKSIEFLIDEVKFKKIELSDDRLEEFIKFRRRLFNGVTFWKMHASYFGYVIPLEFVRQLTDKFTVKYLRIPINEEAGIETALQLMSIFPDSKYMLDLGVALNLTKLMALPSTYKLFFYGYTEEKMQIPADVFCRLIATHEHLTILHRCVIVSRDDFKRIVQVSLNDISRY